MWSTIVLVLLTPSLVTAMTLLPNVTPEQNKTGEVGGDLDPCLLHLQVNPDIINIEMRCDGSLDNCGSAVIPPESCNVTLPARFAINCSGLPEFRANCWHALDLSRNNITQLSIASLDAAPKLDLSHNSLSTLGGLQGNHTGLIRLDLSHNLIDIVSSYAFAGTENLEVLILSHNILISVEPEAFHCRLRKLRLLDLSHNQLTSLGPNVLHGLTALQLLNASHNNLNAISDELAVNNGSLDCEGSKGDTGSAEGAVAWDHFDTLDLNFNNLTWVGDCVLHGPLRKVKTLLMTHNNMTHLPHYSIERLVKLKRLDLSHNLIYWLDVGTFNNDHLEEIDLSHNVLTKIISMAFLYLPKIKLVNLSHNKLNYIYKLAFYRSCKYDQDFEVNLTNNELKADTIWRLVSTFQHLQKTKCQLYVNLKGNHITHFIEDVDIAYAHFLATKNLDFFTAWSHIHFTLGGNPVECNCNLYSEVKLLSHIQYTYADNITNAENLDFWKGLECANMQGSVPAVLDKMKCAPSTVHCPEFCSCKSLQHEVLLVNCSSQGLTEIPPLPPVSQISLNLSFNNIYALFDAHHLTNVTILDLSHNSFTGFDHGVIEQIPHLERLLLHYNQVRHVPQSIKQLDNLTQITLYGNPIMCSCPDAWLRHWLLNNSHLLDHSAAQVTCHSGQRLLEADLCSSSHETLLYSSIVILAATAMFLACVVVFLLCRRANWYASLDRQIGEDQLYDVVIIHATDDSSHLFEIIVNDVIDMCPQARIAPHEAMIPTSRCVVILVSSVFVLKYWQVYRDAVLQHDRTIYVLTEDRMNDLPSDLRESMDRSKVIESFDGRCVATQLLNIIWEADVPSTMASSWDISTDKVSLVPQQKQNLLKNQQKY